MLLYICVEAALDCGPGPLCVIAAQSAIAGGAVARVVVAADVSLRAESEPRPIQKRIGMRDQRALSMLDVDAAD